MLLLKKGVVMMTWFRKAFCKMGGKALTLVAIAVTLVITILTRFVKFRR